MQYVSSDEGLMGSTLEEVWFLSAPWRTDKRRRISAYTLLASQSTSSPPDRRIRQRQHALKQEMGPTGCPPDSAHHARHG